MSAAEPIAAQLPIAARREEIVEALRRHQVLIVAGDTGSGKSTQLPKYCLESCRGTQGLIAHTQPRRLAARALAARIAEEMSQTVGQTVGFRVRFADQISAATRVVLMTDGLLLAELAGDPQLSRYDTIIVDEAHERTLNIDLLLGVLKRLLPIRPDLKLIVTSATLDVERVAGFFNDAPIIAVSGRSYPIELRYAPELTDAVARESSQDDETDLPTAVLQAYREIQAEPGEVGRGDVLVFLPGEREIRDVGELLERELAGQVEVLPLYSRLAWDQQSRIFQSGSRRRVVLATNVAETSITVPGIRAVIDSGLARVSRYSARSRLQRLPIEAISQASADQRKGRCGRLAAGLCLRLYTQSDFDARERFTEPEVLRTNLAALLLRLAADALGAAESFPFIDAPEARALSDGYRILQELQALDSAREITQLGRHMARLPLDPKLSRALCESKRYSAQREMLIIVAGLSVPDVRITGPGAQPDESTGAQVFEDSKSEFMSLVKLWQAYRQMRLGTRRELKRWCKERRLSLLRLSEWEDVYTQVADRAEQIGIVAQKRSASYTGVHRALLCGFCTMVGLRGDDGVYTGTRGVHFHLLPGSPLKRRKPRWIMATSIVETSRVFARRVAEIEPNWIETAAEHLIKRDYLEPDWDEGREAVVARERVGFLGLTLSAGRVVNFGPIAPAEARLIFAREALVYNRLQRRPDWILANDLAIQRAEQMEERLRSRDLLRGAEFFVDFYEKVLPPQVSSYATLEHFSRHLSEEDKRRLALTPDMILTRSPDSEVLTQFPLAAQLGSFSVTLDYRFSPQDSSDGVTVNWPLLALPNSTRAALEAIVPGFVKPRLEALLRSLPKDARRSLIPIGDTISQFMVAAPAFSQDVPGLSEWLRAARGIPESLIRFDQNAIPSHLTPQLAVIENAQIVARGRDVGELRRRCAQRARAALDLRANRVHSAPWRRFELGLLETHLDIDTEQGAVTVYPTLRRINGSVQFGLEWSAAEAQRRLRSGAAALARILLARQSSDLHKKLAADTGLLLAATNQIKSDELIDWILQRTFYSASFQENDPPRSSSEFEQQVDQSRNRLYERCEEFRKTAEGWFAAAREIRRMLDDRRASSLKEAAEESREHLRSLFAGESLLDMPLHWARQLARYLKAEQRRWQRALERRTESPAISQEIVTWTGRYRNLEASLRDQDRWVPELEEFRWWIEEYRISLYTQELKTLGPISAPRLEERAAAIEAWLRR